MTPRMKQRNKKHKKKVVLGKKREKKVIKSKSENMPDAKIKKFLDFKHIEELFLMLSLLNEVELTKFIAHYKDARRSLKKNKKIDKIFLHAQTPQELLSELKNEIVLLLRKEHEDIHQEISILRKKRKDMFIEDLRLMKVSPKIRLFEVTGSKSDFYAVKKIIDSLQKSIPHSQTK